VANVYVPTGVHATSDYGTFIYYDQEIDKTMFKVESGNYVFQSIID